MNVQLKKILRDLTLNRSRSLLVIAAIAVGVMAFGLMRIGGAVLVENLRESFSASQPAASVMVVSPFDDDLVDVVKRVDGVEDAQARAITHALIELGNEKWISLDLYRMPEEPPNINKISFFGSSELERGEIWLERSIGSMAVPGNEVKIKLLNGDTHVLNSAGFVNDLSLLPTPISLTGYGYISKDTAKMLGLSLDYNLLYVRVNDTSSRAAMEETITSAVRKIEDEGYTVFNAPVPEYGKQLLGNNIKTVLLILTSLGNLVLLLSAFLITAVMFAAMNGETRQIGILKSLGAQVSQTMSLYFRQVLLYGLCALIVAIPLSAAGGYFMAQGVGNAMNLTIARFFITAPTILLQTIAALFVPLAAASIPIINGSRISIREAVGDFSVGDAAQLGWVRRVFSFFGELSQVANLSIRNTFRRPGRLALNFATLVLAGAMFIAVIGIRQSIREAAREIQNDILYDVEVNFDKPYSADKAMDAAMIVEGVTYAEAWNISDGRIVFNDDHLSGSIILIGVPADTQLTRPHSVSGRWLHPNDRYTIFLSADALTLNPDLEVGQVIRLRVNGEERNWTIAGFGARSFTPVAYVHYDDLEEMLPQKGRSNRLVVKTTSNAPLFQAQIQTALLDKLEQSNLQARSSTTTTELKTSTAEQMDTLIILLLVMVILIALVGGLGLAITMGLSVMERTREIAVLRSLGGQDEVVRRMVVGEGVLIALISWLASIPASIPIGMRLGDALGISLLSRPLTYGFSYSAAAIWLGLVILIAIFSSVAPATNAVKLTVRDALARE